MKDLADIKKLESILNIKFQNTELLHIAITHSSYAYGRKNVFFNERMEFLGDSVLQLCISEYLFSNYIDKPEGELTKLRSLIVCEDSLYEVSKRWNIGRYILMSKGEELTGGRQRKSILADCVEAIIAAVYLDKGLEVSREFILNNFNEIIVKAVGHKIILDFKTTLQETVQQNKNDIIQYNLLKFEGPPHHREFFTEVLINGVAKGVGNGYSKKEAEQNAAKSALCKLGEENGK